MGLQSKSIELASENLLPTLLSKDLDFAEFWRKNAEEKAMCCWALDILSVFRRRLTLDLSPRMAQVQYMLGPMKLYGFNAQTLATVEKGNCSRKAPFGESPGG